MTPSVSMSRMLPVRGFLLNLEGKIAPGKREYLPREEAHRLLKVLTGQDFGYDTKAWRAWLAQHNVKGQLPPAKN